MKVEKSDWFMAEVAFCDGFMRAFVISCFTINANLVFGFETRATELTELVAFHLVIL
jgi:hypothetical protein